MSNTFTINVKPGEIWSFGHIVLVTKSRDEKITICGNNNLVSSLGGVLKLLSGGHVTSGPKTLNLHGALKARREARDHGEQFRITIPTNTPLPDGYVLCLKLWGNRINHLPMLVLLARRSSLGISHRWSPDESDILD